MSKSIGSIALLLLVTACSKTESPHTVSWYLEHPEEMGKKVVWCADDRQRVQLPECMNAMAASGQKALGKMSDLPPIDWNKPDKKP